MDIITTKSKTYDLAIGDSMYSIEYGTMITLGPDSTWSDEMEGPLHFTRGETLLYVSVVNKNYHDTDGIEIYRQIGEEEVVNTDDYASIKEVVDVFLNDYVHKFLGV